MAADRTSVTTLRGHEIMAGGQWIRIYLTCTNAAAATDYVDINDVTGLPGSAMVGKILFVEAVRDYAGTAVPDAVYWTSTYPDRLVIGTGADSKTRAWMVIAEGTA